MRRSVFRFQRFELQLATRRFLRNGMEVPLEPRTFAVLSYLVENCERVVPTHELLLKVWGGRFVSPASVSVCISNARRALDDTPARQNMIRTVYGEGYQFVGKLQDAEECRTDTDQVQEASFFGRREERARAKEWARSSNTQDRMLLVGGDAGIGKSRFLENLWKYPISPNAFYTLECGQTQHPYSLWTEILGGNSRSDLETIARKTSVRDRSHAYSHYCELLNQRFENPTIVVIDDLHRTDVDSLDLLTFVLTTGRASVRFIATFSTTSSDWPTDFQPFISSHIRRNPKSRIDLAPLGESDIADLVRHHSPAQVIFDPRTVFEACRGNPLFAIMIFSIEGIDLSLPDAELPETITAAATAHLSDLPLESMRIAQLAAVIGDRFSIASLETHVHQPSQSILGCLEDLIRYGVIARSMNRFDTFDFLHPFVRNALYCQIDLGTRREMHRCMAEAMINGTREQDHFRQIAHHLSQSGDSRALSYHVRAAEKAADSFGFGTAANHYRMALSVSDVLPDQTAASRLRLLLDLGRCELFTSQNDDASKTFTSAASLAREIGDPETLSQVALKSAPDFFSIECGVFDIALSQLLEEVYSVVPDHSPTKILLAARMILANLWQPGADDRIEELSRSVRSAISDSGDPGLRVEVLPALWRANWDTDCLSERLEISEFLPSLSGSVDAEKLLVCQVMTVAAFLEVGDLPRLDKEIWMFETLAQQTRHPRALWYAKMFRATKWLMHGDFEEAEERYRSFSSHAAKVGDSNGFHSAALHEFLLLWEAGRTGDLVRRTEKAITRYPNVPGWRAILSFVHCEDGNLYRAELEYETLKRMGIAGARNRVDWMPTFTLGLSQACHVLGDKSFSEVLYRRLQPYQGREAIAGIGAISAGSIDRYLGLLAETMGANELAIRHFRSAIDFDSKFGARPWVVHAQLGLATLLSKLGRTIDALGICRQLIDSAKEIGMRNVAIKGESLLRHLSKRKLSG